MTTKKTKKDDIEALAKLVETAKSTRLSPEQETEATGLIKASLLAGKSGIISAADSVVALPWGIGVDAIVETWPELKAPSRKNLLAALDALQGEQARRFRLSLGRGFFASDAEQALKLIQAVCVEMVSGEGNVPTQNERQIFANVLIGKDKPWLLRLPVAEFKPAEADAVIRCAALACFSRSCPPLTQLHLLRWIASSGRFANIAEDVLEPIAKTVKRWHPKLRDQLKNDVPELPAPILEALKKPESPKQQDDRPEQGQAQPQQSHAQAKYEQHVQAKRDQPQEKRDQQPQAPRQQQKGPAPARITPGNFDLGNALRQIESYAQSLRSELNEAKNELRQRQPSQGRGRGRNRVETSEPDPAAIEELRRHNDQLEETVTELRKQIEDFVNDHEDIAASMKAHDDAPAAEGKEQLQALLGIKLQEHYTDFQKLAKEPPDEVFREHYRLLLEDVFNILKNQGVAFHEI